MKLKKILSKFAESILICAALFDSALGGGALYTVETGQHKFGYFWEEFPSVGLGMSTPVCAMIVGFKLLSSWAKYSIYLRRALLTVWGFWFCSWVTMIATYYVSHQRKVSFEKVYELYFPDHWQAMSVIGTLSIAACTQIMLPAMLAALYGDEIIEKIEAQQRSQNIVAEELEDRKTRIALGELPAQILKDLQATPMGRTKAELATLFDQSEPRIYTALRKLEDENKIVSFPTGQGRTLKYIVSPKESE